MAELKPEPEPCLDNRCPLNGIPISTYMTNGSGKCNGSCKYFQLRKAWFKSL